MNTLKKYQMKTNMMPIKQDTELLATCLSNELGYIVPTRAVERSLKQYNNTLTFEGNKVNSTNNVSSGTFKPTINVQRENDTLKESMLRYIIILTIYSLLVTLLVGVLLF